MPGPHRPTVPTGHVPVHARPPSTQPPSTQPTFPLVRVSYFHWCRSIISTGMGQIFRTAPQKFRLSDRPNYRAVLPTDLTRVRVIKGEGRSSVKRRDPDREGGSKFKMDSIWTHFCGPVHDGRYARQALF